MNFDDQKRLTAFVRRGQAAQAAVDTIISEAVPKCGEPYVGDYSEPGMACDRPRGHAGWHHHSKIPISWPPKSNA